jgi:hypothetical protein
MGSRAGGKVIGKDVGKIRVCKGGRAGGRAGRGVVKVQVRGKQWYGSCQGMGTRKG